MYKICPLHGKYSSDLCIDCEIILEDYKHLNILNVVSHIQEQIRVLQDKVAQLETFISDDPDTLSSLSKVKEG